MHLLFDAHLDLSLNALEWNRDLTKPLQEIHEWESGRVDRQGRGRGTVCLPEMRSGGVGLCVATQLAGCMKPAGPVGVWESPAQAWAMTQAQLAWYQAMTELGEMTMVSDRASLEVHLERWSDPEAAANSGAPIGFILGLEGADSLIEPRFLERAYNYGLRAVGPAHYGAGRYALGHDRDGGLPSLGRELLHRMDDLGMILDVTHLCERSFFEALDIYQGPVWASHSNCRALVDDPRQLSDEQIYLLTERGAVIGVALDAWMLVPGWERGVTTPEEAGVTMEHVADHIDHICQLVGNCLHVGIGSDLDGGFGTEQTPLDLQSIADLQILDPLLARRGYTADDIAAICHGNFVRFLREAWR